MKKTTLGILIVSIACMVVGATGTGLYAKKLTNERDKNNIHEVIDNENTNTLIIEANNLSGITIGQSSSNEITVDQYSSNFLESNTNKVSLTTKKKDKQMTLNMNSKKIKNSPSILGFSQHSYQDDVFINIPSSYTSVILKGDKTNYNISEITTKELTLDVSDGVVNINSATLDELNATGNSTYFHLSEVAADKLIEVNSEKGDVNLYSGIAENINITTAEGNIFTANSKGKLTLDSSSGDISLNHTVGDTKITTNTGNITYHNLNNNSETKLTSTHGDIFLEIAKNNINDSKLDLDTTLGDIIYYEDDEYSEDHMSDNMPHKKDATDDKDKKVSDDKKNVKIKATTKNGDIIIQEIDPDDTYYGYH